MRSFCRRGKRPLLGTRPDVRGRCGGQPGCQPCAEPHHRGFHQMVEGHGQSDAEREQGGVTDGRRLIFEQHQRGPLRVQVGEINAIGIPGDQFGGFIQRRPTQFGKPRRGQTDHQAERPTRDGFMVKIVSHRLHAGGRQQDQRPAEKWKRTP